MKKTGTKSFSQSNSKIKGKKLILSSVFGALMGILSLILIILGLSAICMALSSPHRLILPLCFFAIYSSAFFCGLFSLKRNGSSDALLCGAISGTLFMISLSLVLALLRYIMASDDGITLSFLWKLIIIPVSIIGAFAGISSNGKKTKRKF